jgi:hypothetical protein
VPREEPLLILEGFGPPVREGVELREGELPKLGRLEPDARGRVDALGPLGVVALDGEGCAG